MNKYIKGLCFSLAVNATLMFATQSVQSNQNEKRQAVKVATCCRCSKEHMIGCSPTRGRSVCTVCLHKLGARILGVEHYLKQVQEKVSHRDQPLAKELSELREILKTVSEWPKECKWALRVLLPYVRSSEFRLHLALSANKHASQLIAKLGDDLFKDNDNARRLYEMTIKEYQVEIAIPNDASAYTNLNEMITQEERYKKIYGRPARDLARGHLQLLSRKLKQWQEFVNRFVYLKGQTEDSEQRKLLAEFGKQSCRMVRFFSTRYEELQSCKDLNSWKKHNKRQNVLRALKTLENVDNAHESFWHVLEVSEKTNRLSSNPKVKAQIINLLPQYRSSPK